MHTPRNPADLLGLGRDPSLIRLLRACGTDEACITGPASDYDKFTALAAALPLCEGHPLRDEVNTRLAEATGRRLPLCPHTAKMYWDIWVGIYLCGEKMEVRPDGEICPLCSPGMPPVWRERELTRLPDPWDVSALDLTAWSEALEACLPDAAPALFSIPHDYAFIRPNPYHANLAVGKVCRGEVPDKSERDLLVTQALRIWGIARARREAGKTPALLLRGGDPAAITSLLAYLDMSKALPPMIWIPDEPSLAGEISGLYGHVGTGYVSSETATPAMTEEAKRAYASVSPVGSGILLVEG